MPSTLPPAVNAVPSNALVLDSVVIVTGFGVIWYVLVIVPA